MPEMPHSRKRRLAANTVFSMISWFFPLVVSFFATPIIVRGLGNENYGLYALITGFISYSFGFGIGKTAAKYVSEYKASGETQKISEVLSAIFWFSLAIGLFGTTIIAIFAHFIAAEILQIPPDMQANATIALYLAAGTIVVYMLSQVFQFSLQGLHRFDRYSLLINLNGILINCGGIAIVWRGGGVVALLCWNLFVICLICLLFYISAKRLLPEARIRFRVEREMTISVLKYGSSIIMYQFFANLLLVFERGWITRKFGPEAVTFYVVPMSLGIYLHGFTSTLVIVLFPFVNELLADKEKLIMLYQKANKIVVAVIAFCVMTFICSGKLFLGVWISRDFADAAFGVLVIHVITFGLLAIVSISWQLAEGFGRASLNAICTFVWVIISIPLMILSANYWHNEGIAASRLIGVLATLPLVFYIEKRFLVRIAWKFWLRMLASIAAALLLASVIEVEIFTRFDQTWVILLLGAMAGGVGYAVILLTLGYLTREERTMLRDMLPGR
jgi:O-antigen/teichoic acid export membrane protein